MKTRVLAGVMLTLAVTLSVVAFPQVEAASNSWVTKAPHPLPGIEDHAVVVAGGVLYTIGGWDGSDEVAEAYAYYPATNSWLMRAPMPTARAELAAAVVSSSPAVIYAVGGRDTLGNVMTTNEAYYPDTNAWVTRAPMRVPRIYPAAAMVNGIVYVIGGSERYESPSIPIGPVVSTNEAYYPSTNSWVFKRPMPTPRGGLMVAVVRNVIYAIGGYDNGGDPLNVVEAYYPQTNSWVRKKSLPIAVMEAAVAVVEDVIFIFGGEAYVPIITGGISNNLFLSDLTQAYYYRTNSWVQKAPMPTARREMAAGVINGVAYVVGGTTAPGLASFNVNEAYYYR